MRAVEAQPRPRGVGANCCNVSSRRNRGIARSLRRKGWWEVSARCWPPARLLAVCAELRHRGP